MAGPSPAKCQVSASNATPNFPADGGTGNIVVQAARECAWSAAAQAGWIAIVPPNEGQGEATLKYSVQANPAGIPRSGTIAVGGQSVEVAQQAAPCRFSADRTTWNVPAAGGSIEIALQAPAGCGWSAQSEAEWATVDAGRTGSGPGVIRVRLAANGGPQRRTAVTAGGVRVDIVQQAAAGPQPPTPEPPAPPPPPAPGPPPPAPGPEPPPACTYAVDAADVALGPSGGSGRVGVQAGSGCEWTATSQASWLIVTAGSTGSGNGEVRWEAEPNTSTSARTGALIVAGQTVTFRQEGAAPPPPPPTCEYTVTPLEATVGAGGGSDSIRVRSGKDCAWTATTETAWLTITAGAAGTGDGDVRWTAAANTTTAARTGTIVVAGQTVTITQQAGEAPPPPPPAGEEVSFSGPVSNATGSCPAVTFQVGSTTVRTSASTVYTRGDCGKIDTKNVEVKGTGLLADGVVQAISIEFTKGDDIVFE